MLTTHQYYKSKSCFSFLTSGRRFGLGSLGRLSKSSSPSSGS